jgi:hypothetical protein
VERYPLAQIFVFGEHGETSRITVKPARRESGGAKI